MMMTVNKASDLLIANLGMVRLDMVNGLEFLKPCSSKCYFKLLITFSQICIRLQLLWITVEEKRKNPLNL